MNIFYSRALFNMYKVKILNWIKLFSIAGISQIIIQILGFFCGILIIRLLSPEEYAYYTIANTLLGSMTVLADAGISNGVMSEGGQVWLDRRKLGIVLSSGFALRKKFAIVSSVLGLPILWFILFKQGADFYTILFIISSTILSYYASLIDTLLQVIPKLHQEINALQKNQIIVGVFRALLYGLTLFLFPWASFAILINSLPRIYGNKNLKSIASKFVEPNQKPDPFIQNNIIKIVKRILPGSIYYCLLGQISIWLLSVFGNTNSIAEIGAIGRFSMILNMLSILISTIFIPRFARLPKFRSVLNIYYLKLFFLTIFISITVIIVFYLFGDLALWLLGENYKNLKKELVLSIVSGSANLISGTLFGLNTARGWPTNPVLIICCSITGIIIGCNVFRIDSLIGVIKFNIFINSIPIFFHYFSFKSKVAKL